MKIKAIICEALYREFCVGAAYSRNLVDITTLDFGLHNTPDILRSRIQEEIDSVDNSDYDVVVLGYGLCSRGTADIVSRSKPLVIIRAHDCITVLLGSRKKYEEEFRSNPGTYYYSSGWIERKESDTDQGSMVDVWKSEYEQKLIEYTEKYGADNAEFLLEQEKTWLANYNRAAFIDLGVGDVASYRKFVSELALERGWECAELEGNLGLVNRLLSGSYEDDNDLLVVSPGKKIIESFDADVCRCAA